MSRFKKHLGQNNEIEIDGETYTLKHLSTENIPDFMNAAKAFGNVKEGEESDMFKNLDNDSITAMKNLVNDTLKVSFPDDWKDDEAEMKQFGFKYMMILLPKILEINSANIDPSHENIKSADVRDRISKIQQPVDKVQQSTTK